VSWHARRVIEAAKARKIATAAVRVQQYANGFTGSDEDALTQLETFTWTELHAALDDAQEAPLISVSEAVTAYVASLTSGTNPEPLPTGLTDLDAIVRLMPGNFTVVAARPAVGKSVVALKMALSSAAAGNRVLFVSLEMSREEIVSRALAALSGLTIEQVTQGIRERGEHEQKILETQQELSRYPLSIVDAGGVSVAMIAAWVRKAARRNDPIRMLVVDYLQLLTPGRNRENRQVEVAEISRSLKNLARDSNAVVVGVAQVNRASEMRADKRPSMGDLRDSGQIEADADHILLLHRPDLYDKSSEHLGELSIHVAKNRHGSEGIVHVVHQFHRGTVSNLA
jgi:replicative DNA helicase